MAQTKNPGIYVLRLQKDQSMSEYKHELGKYVTKSDWWILDDAQSQKRIRVIGTVSFILFGRQEGDCNN